VDVALMRPVNADDIELDLLLQAIYLKYQYDFRNYARASLKRRVSQACERFSCDSVGMLQDRLLHDATLFSQLLQFLTIQVSDMFRDPGFFRALRLDVAPILRTYPSIKVWVAGCSTGEEVYSVAILLKETGLLGRSMIYATDINDEGLQKASTGVYDIDRVAQFSTNYRAAGGTQSLSDYYTAAYGRAVFDKALRENVVFADHSLATDGVFTETHLITCRNVLIYFNRELQDRALGLFCDSLTRGCFLGLGGKETLSFSSYSTAFREFNTRERIYRKAE
jgi:chemotaxis protein methyltransferase CheR